MIKNILTLIRPHQWVKNVFVFMPLFFGGQLFNWWSFQQALIAFFSFSFMSSAVYCINDLNDIEADRKHPKKCKRPLASGSLAPIHAIFMSCILVVLSVIFCVFLLEDNNYEVTLIITLYFVMNLAYCFSLKQYAIIDVFILSLGFVMRLICGGLSCNVTLSPWIVLMTLLLALFLAFAKRRDDILIYEQENILVRKNIIRYNLPFLNLTLGIIGAITIVCYIMYTVSPLTIDIYHTKYVYITSVFVLISILRYLQITIVDSKSGSPTKILTSDRFIQICILLWVVSFVILLYL